MRLLVPVYDLRPVMEAELRVASLVDFFMVRATDIVMEFMVEGYCFSLKS